MTESAHVLVVEDDETLRDLYEAILLANNMRVTTAINGLDGLSKLKGGEPDVILLDYFMPVMDGIGFLKNFDAQMYTKVKVIALTNISDPAALNELLFSGAHKYALKSSLEPNDLIDLIDEVLV